MTEWDRMVAGEPYDPNDPALLARRRRARVLCRELGALEALGEGDAPARRRVLTELLGRGGDTATIEPPFHCDYGSNLELGERVYLNVGCVALDVCRIAIGAVTLIGPGVHIYAATHPLDAAERRVRESGRPVTIGSDVWIGGGAILLPGVTIGDRAVIGAGGVVTRDVPAGVLAIGNPCRVVRSIE